MPKLKKIQTLHETLKVVCEPTSTDLIPGEAFQWRRILPKVHQMSQTFGYQRVETSPVETPDLYHNNGDLLHLASDQFVHLETNSSKKLTLRPHNFLSVLRAYTANRVSEHERITKWYYIEPAFSAGKNSLGHLYEFGAVVFGEPTSISDAQMMTMLRSLLREFGIVNVVFEVNSKGCENCAVYYEEVLTRFLQQNKYDLCPTCQQYLGREQSRNHACSDEGMCGVFSCAGEHCMAILNSAPQIIDYLCAACNRQLTSLLETLDELEVTYQLNPRLFGNHWFSHTIFRVNVSSSASIAGRPDVTLGIGGRKNRFVSRLTGQNIPTLAFSVPLNVIWQLVESHGVEQKPEKTADVFLINLGELAAKKSLRLFLDLLSNHITVAENFGENGIKNQFKLAERKGCPIALVIGQKEALEGNVILRDVRCGTQEVFASDRIIEEVKKRLQD